MMQETAAQATLLTIGYSTHEVDEFVALLRRHDANAVADVRSAPYSRWRPQFNRDVLPKTLKTHGIAYVYLGKELGGRSDHPDCRDASGRVEYRLLVRTSLFQDGIRRIRNGSRSRKIALMCAEKDPLNCHRALLIAPELLRQGMQVAHILEDGRLEPHQALEKRLMEKMKESKVSDQEDMFHAPEELAYITRQRRVAHKRTEETEQ